MHHNNIFNFVMEIRMSTLELVVEKNTQMVERLDRSMNSLTHAMADLRVQMSKGFADVRFEMMRDQAELRREMTANYGKLQCQISSVPARSYRGASTGFVNIQNNFDPIFFGLVALHFIIAFTLFGFMARDVIDFYLK